VAWKESEAGYMKICIRGREDLTTTIRVILRGSYTNPTLDILLRGSLFHAFDHYRSSVRQDLGHSLHDLGRVITRADNCIAAQFRSVL
jgi:hypothetical protein